MDTSLSRLFKSFLRLAAVSANNMRHVRRAKKKIFICRRILNILPLPAQADSCILLTTILCLLLEALDLYLCLCSLKQYFYVPVKDSSKTGAALVLCHSSSFQYVRTGVMTKPLCEASKQTILPYNPRLSFLNWPIVTQELCQDHDSKGPHESSQLDTDMDFNYKQGEAFVCVL